MLNTNKINILPSIERNPASAATGSVIWLHGLGANGNDFAPLVPELRTAHQLPVRFIFPHAPSIPVTINNGYVMPAWYDITSLSIEQRVDETGIRDSIKQIELLIEREHRLGIPTNKIVLAGFSQGAVVALLTGLSYTRPLGGILALSGYLPWPEKVIPAEKSVNKNTPIFIGHGTEDMIVPSMLGKLAYDTLHKQNYQVSLHNYPIPHSVSEKEIQDIDHWLTRILS